MGSLVQPAQTLKRDADAFLRRTVQDLFSLSGRTIVITGGARGIGLALAFAVTEVGGNVAILDALDTPHEHYYKLEKNPNVKVKLYKSVPDVPGALSDMNCPLTAPTGL
jgi:sorbose reductase